MTELMAAMVLSNLSSSPVFHNPPVQNLKGSLLAVSNMLFAASVFFNVLL